MKYLQPLWDILGQSRRNNTSAFAAESALFIIMSFVPFLFLLMTLLKYTPITEATLMNFVYSIAPEALHASIKEIVADIYKSTSTTVILITIFSLIWASGKGFVSLIRGLDAVFGVPYSRNWFVQRILSILYTLVFIIVIVFSLGVYVLSTEIFQLIRPHFPVIADFIASIMDFRALITLFVFTILFNLLYVVLPKRQTKIRYQFPGAIFSAVGWMGFSYCFSIYVKYSHNLSILYGSLTSVVLTMLWLYICMYIFLLGAEINMWIEQHRAKREYLI